MKKFFIYYLVTTVLASLPSGASARSISLDEIWTEVRTKNGAIESAALKKQASDEGSSRSRQHWLPQLYLDARSYSTNDPANAFMGILEQRQMGSSDFSPEALNHPDNQTFSRGALGLDWGLYEGGAKAAQVAMYDKMAESSGLEQTQAEIDTYSQLSMSFISLSALQSQKKKLNELNESLSALMRRYQLGQKSNPVGYSGLLGMKSLQNRILGMLDQLSAKENAFYHGIEALGFSEKNWQPQRQDLKSFLTQYLPPSSESRDEYSYRSQARKLSAQSAQDISKMEKARILPRIGVFAESYMFNGERDTASGYTAGVYLRWNLLDGSNHHRYKEAALQAQAADKMSETFAKQEVAEKRGLQEKERALLTNLDRLDESEKLLQEQSQVSTTLFRNGSINALQFVEILNRRTDLIQQKTEAELELISARASIVMKTEFKTPSTVTVREP